MVQFRVSGLRVRIWPLRVLLCRVRSSGLKRVEGAGLRAEGLEFFYN